jgi:hypothetical protein
MRQIHRWTSIVFTAGVVANIAVLGRKQPPIWVGVLALFPLIVLFFTGLYLFVLPYAAKWLGGRRAESPPIVGA